MKKAVYLSCADRVKQHPKGSLHADDGQLFCTCCNVTLDHTRKGSIDRHFQTPDFKMSLNNVALRNKQRFPARSKEQRCAFRTGRSTDGDQHSALQIRPSPATRLSAEEHYEFGSIPNNASVESTLFTKGL